MKPYTLAGIFGFCLLMLCSILIDNNRKTTTYDAPQEWFDTNVSVSDVIYKKHEYRIYEVGERTSSGYSMTMEHKMDCAECMKIFD